MILKLSTRSGLILSYILLVTVGLFAQQTPVTTPSPSSSDANNSKNTGTAPTRTASTAASQVDRAQETNDRSQPEDLTEEEAAILPYYNNYLREYHLGPEDVISVEVFGQANYSKTGIVIPPTSRISYPLIPGGVFVGGKTVEQVAEDIKKKLDEYIIDPKVTVSLDKVGSARFSVLGKVVTPGVKTMSRRYNLYEAIAEAGGIDKEGDKKRIVLVRLNSTGGFSQMVIDMGKVLKGEQEVVYLLPGDQIIVPEKRWSLTKIISTVTRAAALPALFGVTY